MGRGIGMLLFVFTHLRSSLPLPERCCVACAAGLFWQADFLYPLLWTPARRSDVKARKLLVAIVCCMLELRHLDRSAPSVPPPPFYGWFGVVDEPLSPQLACCRLVGWGRALTPHPTCSHACCSHLLGVWCAAVWCAVVCSALVPGSWQA